MNKLYLLLGSNMGERLQHLQNGIDLIKKGIGNILRQSSVYKTAAWGNTEQNSFLNLVVLIETKLSPQEILERIIAIEKKLGRVRKEKWEARIIDIDILIYNKEVVEKVDLKIPHPYLHLRKFTLIPLAEIAADYIHPVLMKTVTDILKECKDELPVEKFELGTIEW